MLISALSASISRACSLTRETSCSRSAFIFSLDGPTSVTTRDWVELSSFSKRCWRAVSSATRSSLSVLSLVACDSSAAALSSCFFHARSSLALASSTWRSCSLSSSAARFTLIRSSTSRSTSCPNLSFCTSRARASSSLSRSSFTLFFLVRVTWARRSSFWSWRSDSFSSLSSSMRERSWERPALVKTMVWERSGGSRPSMRHVIWCILSVTMTSISLRRCCLKVWKVWISASACLRAVSIIFSFLDRPSFSLRSASTARVISATTSS
mmetsp:Transcript_3550/g.7770  ORF Transcript_3550/g.7770 Transcript_3550/m.7770 type:complete len:268 (-) Transcript_3550:119-922(-)